MDEDKANASKHKALSYKRMKEERRGGGGVAELLKKAESADEEEDPSGVWYDKMVRSTQAIGLQGEPTEKIREAGQLWE